MSSAAYDRSRRYLRDLAATVTEPIIEIGVHRGKSLKALAEGNDLVPIIGIDAWGLPGLYSPDSHEGHAYADWYAHMATAYHRVRNHPNVSIYRAYATEIGRHWTGPVGLWFHDGDHTYEGLAADFDAWQPDGVLVFDDYNEEFPDVVRFVDERWIPEVVCGRLAVVR